MILATFEFHYQTPAAALAGAAGIAALRRYTHKVHDIDLQKVESGEHKGDYRLFLTLEEIEKNVA